MAAEPRTNILIVDDSPDKLLAMTAALADLNQNVVTALSGREALRQLLQHDFAVVLLDVNMPDIGGFETASMIRKRKSSARVPIIFVTAYGDDAYAAQGYSLGAVDYIMTPVVPEVLQAKVSVFVELHRQKALIKQQAEQEIALHHEQAARKTAEAANRMKDEFLAVLSHELRTPLGVILGWAQLLRLGECNDEELANGLEIIERNAKAQAKIIEDLLDVSRIISGKLELELRATNLTEIVEAALSDVEHGVETQQLAIERQFEADLPLIDADPTRLQQVVWNLLSNAVKFTPQGGTIVVSARRLGSQVEISVQDNGEGIPSEFLPYVFDRFRQADASTKRRHGGLGIGLAIVRQLVEMHYGEIVADSPGPGKGSTFTIRLPVSAPQTTAARSAAPPLTRSDAVVESNDQLSGLRVLVVDDHQDARDLIEKILSEGHAVTKGAESADEALTILEQFRPHVLISDVGMPGRDGYELIREIRRLGNTEMPAIALTAYARPEERQLALDAGFQVHIAKPVDPAELLATVARIATHVARNDSPQFGRPRPADHGLRPSGASVIPTP